MTADAGWDARLSLCQRCSFGDSSSGVCDNANDQRHAASRIRNPRNADSERTILSQRWTAASVRSHVDNVYVATRSSRTASLVEKRRCLTRSKETETITPMPTDTDKTDFRRCVVNNYATPDDQARFLKLGWLTKSIGSNPRDTWVYTTHDHTTETTTISAEGRRILTELLK